MQLLLARTTRFTVNHTDAQQPQPHNSYAAAPSMVGIGAHYELTLRCNGTADPTTGYFINIKHLDQLAREHAIPILTNAARTTPHKHPALPLADALNAIKPHLQSLTQITWHLSPYYQITMHAQHTDTAIIEQTFDFAAAHRLNAPALSTSENQEVFGKCNNPAGHGHNYQFRPAVRIPLDTDQPPFTLQQLEKITHDHILSRYDHTHLNIDLDEFNQQKHPDSALNPSVENIAKALYERLNNALNETHPHVSLEHITVWETEKTSCTYPAPPSPT